MPAHGEPVAALQAALLARALAEQAAGGADGLDLDDVLDHYGVNESAGGVLDELLARPESRGQQSKEAAGENGGDALASARRQRAALELQLKTVTASLEERERAVQRQKVEHDEALHNLKLQQQRLQEYKGERAVFLDKIADLEERLQNQVNATEQVELQYEKLKSQRGSVGDVATQQTQRINELEAEVAALKAELERTRQERDAQLNSAASATRAAESLRADDAFQRIWLDLHNAAPEFFLKTHVPNEETFHNLAHAFVDLLRAFLVCESHVHHMLGALRQAGDRTDKLTQVRNALRQMPGVLDTTREFVIVGGRARRKNLENTARAVQCWMRAFATGLHQVLVKAESTARDELNWRQWQLKKRFGVTEDALIGEYYKETGYKLLPARLGTVFLKQAGDMSFEVYNQIIAQRA